MKNIAIIPIKKKSARFPKKNKIKFLGKSIFRHSIDSAIKSKLFDKVIISTDDMWVKKYCNNINNSKIFVLDRPKKLATNTSSLNDVINHAINSYSKLEKLKNFCLLFATSPLRDHHDIIKSHNILKRKNSNGVVGSKETLDYYPSFTISNTGNIQHLFNTKKKLTNLRYQDVPRTFVDNSSLAWVKYSAFKKYYSWIPKNCHSYLMPNYKSIDINFPTDLELLKFYYKKYAKK